MANLKMVNLAAAFAFGAVGYLSGKIMQDAKEQKIFDSHSSAKNSENLVINGFKISDISDDALKELAEKIDRNPLHKGKDDGVLEHGKEMSIFLQRASEVIYFDKQQKKTANEIINKIADTANEDTYNEFKKICYKNGENGYKKGLLWPIIDRMTDKFEQKTDDINLIEENKTEEVSNNQIDNKYSHEYIVKNFYPSLVNLCGGSIVTAVLRFRDVTGLDDENVLAQAKKINLPDKIDGCELNKDAYKRFATVEQQRNVA